MDISVLVSVWKWLGLVLVVPMILAHVVLAQEVVSYYNLCNNQVALGDGAYAAILNYTIEPNTQECPINIQSVYSGHYLRFHVSNFHQCFCGGSKSCLNDNVLTAFVNDRVWSTYCYGAGSTESEVSTNNGPLTFILDTRASHLIGTFVINVYTVHFGKCTSGEASCGACVNRNLACYYGDTYCDHEKYGVCSDTIVDSNTGGVAGYVIGAIVIVALVLVAVFLSRYKKGPCRKRSSQDNDGESVANRARAIFTVQFTTRQVQSNSGAHQNEAYTEDGDVIDVTTFEPPPEYSSLENLASPDQSASGRTNNSADNSHAADNSADKPPSYCEIMINMEKYNVKIEDMYVG